MDRMKQLIKYVLWIIGFFILSNFLINVSLNSSYNGMQRLDKNYQIDVYQAESTKINGRIRGVILSEETDEISGKYLKTELYSERDILLGTTYVELGYIEETEAFEILFDVDNVESYKMEIVDTKPEAEPITLLSTELTQSQIIFGTIVVMLIFWA